MYMLMIVPLMRNSDELSGIDVGVGLRRLNKY